MCVILITPIDELARCGKGVLSPVRLMLKTENYLLICQRYIELNPVRAKGMVDHPSEYPWSSYGYNAPGDVDPLITQHEEYNIRVVQDGMTD